MFDILTVVPVFFNMKLSNGLIILVVMLTLLAESRGLKCYMCGVTDPDCVDMKGKTEEQDGVDCPASANVCITSYSAANNAETADRRCLSVPATTEMKCKSEGSPPTTICFCNTDFCNGDPVPSDKSASSVSVSSFFFVILSSFAAVMFQN